ncbi:MULTISPECIES: hypothetical protein [unclassified Vibrio]|uniref:hypothetical protein n=1 Tax=Vibrio TaxID=662 RepID=UPI0020A51240|nr:MULTISPECIES: hypothetical protein [unclassified Vibrio]
MKIGICVICYNRLDAASRVFSTLSEAQFNQDVEIIASIDYSKSQGQMVDLFTSYYWGDKKTRLVTYNNNLGLKQHVLSCGDLVKDYDLLVLIEEDLYISHFFENYLVSSYYLSRSEPKLGGISLYSYTRNEDDKVDFRPCIDSFDNYYLQFPSSWGFAITQKQWGDFRAWLSFNDCETFTDDLLPQYICRWSKQSWKKHYARYLVHTGKYFSYPRYSLTSNPGLAGSHHFGIKGLYSVPVCLAERDWKLGSVDSSLSIYDVNFSSTRSVHDDDGFYSHGVERPTNKGEYIADNFYLNLRDLYSVLFNCVKKFLVKVAGKLKVLK